MRTSMRHSLMKTVQIQIQMPAQLLISTYTKGHLQSAIELRHDRAVKGSLRQAPVVPRSGNRKTVTALLDAQKMTRWTPTTHKAW